VEGILVGLHETSDLFLSLPRLRGKEIQGRPSPKPMMHFRVSDLSQKDEGRLVGIIERPSWENCSRRRREPAIAEGKQGIF